MIRRTALLAFSALIPGFSRIFALSVLARFLPEVLVGELRQILLYVEVLAVILSCQLQSGMLYYCPEGKAPREQAHTVAQTLLLAAAMGLFGFCAVAALSHPFSLWIGKPGAAPLFCLYAVSLPMQVFGFFLAPSAVILGQSSLALRQALARSVCETAAMVFGAVCFPTLRGMILMLLGGHLLAFLLGGWIPVFNMLRLRQVALKPDMDYMKKLLAFSLPLAGSGGIKILADKLDRIFVSAAFSKVDFAVYSLSSIENPLTDPLLGGFATANTSPMRAAQEAKDMNRFWEIWNRGILFTASITLPLSLILFCFAGGIIDLVLGGGEYSRGIWILKIYSMAALFRCAGYQNLLRIMGVTGYHFLFALTSALVGFGALTVGLKYFGLPGAACAFVAGFAFYNISILIFLKIKFGCSLLLSSGIWQIANVLLASVAAMVGAWGFYSLNILDCGWDTKSGLAVWIPIYVLFYCVFALFLGFPGYADLWKYLRAGNERKEGGR